MISPIQFLLAAEPGAKGSLASGWRSGSEVVLMMACGGGLATGELGMGADNLELFARDYG